MQNGHTASGPLPGCAPLSIGSRRPARLLYQTHLFTGQVRATNLCSARPVQLYNSSLQLSLCECHASVSGSALRRMQSMRSQIGAGSRFVAVPPLLDQEPSALSRAAPLLPRDRAIVVSVERVESILAPLLLRDGAIVVAVDLVEDRQLRRRGNLRGGRVDSWQRAHLHRRRLHRGERLLRLHRRLREGDGERHGAAQDDDHRLLDLLHIDAEALHAVRDHGGVEVVPAGQGLPHGGLRHRAVAVADEDVRHGPGRPGQLDLVAGVVRLGAPEELRAEEDVRHARQARRGVVEGRGALAEGHGRVGAAAAGDAEAGGDLHHRLRHLHRLDERLGGRARALLRDQRHRGLHVPGLHHRRVEVPLGLLALALLGALLRRHAEVRGETRHAQEREDDEDPAKAWHAAGCLLLVARDHGAIEGAAGQHHVNFRHGHVGDLALATAGRARLGVVDRVLLAIHHKV
mmetsp:Transcript_37194/g.96065  ORF Transcript_37194/g.96065 Transcript_37194/m.96065 type:complete len:460 (-) Transcript_37194:1564-2943(-)